MKIREHTDIQLRINILVTTLYGVHFRSCLVMNELMFMYCNDIYFDDDCIYIIQPT